MFLLTKKLKVWAGSGILVLYFILLAIPNALALQDAIIAVVNDDVITLKDLKDYLNSIYMQLRLEGRKPSEIENIMRNLESDGIRKLVEDKLILSEAARQGLEVREEIVDKRINEIKRNYPSEQIFLDSLLVEGATVTDLKKKIREQLQLQYILDVEVRSKISVNPQEVTDYYKQHFEKYQQPDSVNLESIFISHADDSVKSKEKVTEAYQLLTDGKDFPQVAEQYSEAPSIGIIAKDQLLPSIEETVFALQEGEISSPVEVEKGFYIFKIKEKIPEKIASLEEVKDIVSENIFQIKYKERFMEWIDKLKKQAFIEIKQ